MDAEICELHHSSNVISGWEIFQKILTSRQSSRNISVVGLNSNSRNANEELDLNPDPEGSQFLVTALLAEGGSILLAFLAVGCVGLVMFYLVNGIYVLSLILIQLLMDEGVPGSASKSPDLRYQRKRDLIRNLVWDQILLYRWWQREKQSSSRSRSREEELRTLRLRNKFKRIA